MIRYYKIDILKALDNIRQVCYELDIEDMSEDCIKHEEFAYCIVAGEPYNVYCLHCDKLIRTVPYDPDKMTVSILRDDNG